jgi:hypothetical protein
MTKGVLAAGFAATLLTCGTLRAAADPLETTFALTVNPLSGQHEVGDRQNDRFTFAPLPMGELTVRRGNESLRVEGLPPIAFNYGSGPNLSVGIRTTRLSILNATVRHAFAGGWFAGVGETVYTQRTDYADVPAGYYYLRNGRIYFLNGSQTESSRIGGLRLEAGRTVRVGRDRIEAGAALNPSMHGDEYLVIPPGPFTSCTFFPGGSVSCPGNSFVDPETATQIDAYARIAHRVSRNGEVIFGVRYLNFTARYSDLPGQLADRNVGWAPVLGYRLRL